MLAQGTSPKMVCWAITSSRARRERSIATLLRSPIRSGGVERLGACRVEVQRLVAARLIAAVLAAVQDRQ